MNVDSHAAKETDTGNEKRTPEDRQCYTQPLHAVTNSRAYLTITA